MKLISTKEENDLYKAISIAFEDDDKLIKDYHIIGKTYENCVNDTYNRILEESKISELFWYVVCNEDGYMIGFIVVSLQYQILYSFGLNIKFRKDFSEEFFNKISELLYNCFGCGLYNKNERGIKFLLRNGMEIVLRDEEKTILKLCH
jgi:hypothetical protein